MSLANELKRRSVFRVTFAYLVVGWLLTEVLTTLLPTLGAPAWTPRAVILAFALGFIPTVVLSWIYQWTPDGVKRDSEVRGGTDSPGSTRTFDYIVITAVVVLVFVIAFLGAQPSLIGKPEDTATASNASVAVLPFVNMSGDKDNEYFSDGLTETLLHMLTQIPGLQVAARTSSFAFKGQNVNISEIAAALNVAHILEGSVQRAGDRVRITAQLIRADDGFHVWSSNFDFVIDDIFAIQDEIAARVGNELSESLLGVSTDSTAAGVGTQQTDAYDLYLHALGERATFSFRGLQAAENLLKGALAIDPGYLDAKTELANNFLRQSETGLIEQNEARTRIVAITDQVLAERSTDPGATALRLYVQTAAPMLAGDSSPVFDAIDRLEQLVADNPADHRIRALLGRLLRRVRQLDRAVEIYLDALQHDAFNAQIHYELGTLYMDLENFQAARESLTKSLELEPRQPNAYMSLAEIERYAGDGVAFLQQMLKAIAVDPQDHEIPGTIAIVLYRLGLVEEGDDFRNQVFAIAPTSEIAYQVELARAVATGDEAASVASARRAIEDDIEDRRFAYGGAVRHLLRVAVRNGTASEELAWLEDVAPGILKIDAASAQAKYRVAQFVALDAWYSTLTRDELLRRIEQLQQGAAMFDGNPFEDPDVQMTVKAMRGEIEDAIDVALTSVFSESVLTHLGWQESVELAQFSEMGADDRIQAAMQRWRDEQAAQSGQVRTYLAELSAT